MCLWFALWSSPYLPERGCENSVAIVDAHQHFWDLTHADCVWPTVDLAPIYKNFGPHDYREAIAGTEVVGSVLVQSQACDSDTDYLLELAANDDAVLAVVGWVDLADVGAAKRIGDLAGFRKLRGLRPMLQAIDDSEWILGENLQAGINAMIEQSLRFDALIQPRHLAAIYKFAKRHRDLLLVVDHGAKPDIAKGAYTHWSEGMKRLGELPNVYCKLSGLFTEASAQQVAQPEVFVPWVKHLVTCFGAQRLMWGSDWPVVNLAGSLSSWLGATRELLIEMGISSEEMSLIFNGSARCFYSLDK